MGDIFRWVGHSDSTSTRLNPRPSICRVRALRIAFWVALRCFWSYSAVRSTYTGPLRPAIISATRSGSPSRMPRPWGVVEEVMPVRVVGAICPPVMP